MLSGENKPLRKLRSRQQNVNHIHELEEKVKELKAVSPAVELGDNEIDRRSIQMNRKNQRRMDKVSYHSMRHSSSTFEYSPAAIKGSQRRGNGVGARCRRSPSW